jgi:hypothetical protein
LITLVLLARNPNLEPQSLSTLKYLYRTTEKGVKSYAFDPNIHLKTRSAVYNYTV